MFGYGRYGDLGSRRLDDSPRRSSGYFGYGGQPREPECDHISEAVHDAYHGYMAKARATQRKREETTGIKDNFIL